MIGKNQKETLLIDIGSAAVSGALLDTHKNGLPQIGAVSRVPIGSGTKATREALEPKMFEALKKLLEQYKTHKGVVRVVLGSPWHNARIRVVSSHSKKAKVVTEKTIEKTVEKYQDEKPPASGNVDLEAVAVQVMVNGYNTAVKHPVRGTSLKINLYESEISSGLYKKITDTFGSVLPHNRISFSTFPMVALASLRQITDEESFVFVDVSGELTDVGVVYEDGLHYLASFPTGYLSIARDVGGDSVGDASSRLSLMIRNELSVDEEAIINQQFQKSFATWITSFEEVVKNASEKIPVPHSVFVMSGKEPLRWIKKGFDEQNTLNMKARPVEASSVQRHVALGEGGSFDVFLALSALFFHTGEDDVIGENHPRRGVHQRT